jgi:hypothetical protein
MAWVCRIQRNSKKCAPGGAKCGLQPYVCTCLLLPWLHLLSPPHTQAVQTGLATLGSLVNTLRLALPT